MNTSLLALNAAANAGPAAAGVTPGSPHASPDTEETEAGFAQLLEQAAGEQLLPGAGVSTPDAEESVEGEVEEGLAGAGEKVVDGEWASPFITLPPITQPVARLPDIPTTTEPLSATALAASIGLAIAPSVDSENVQDEVATLPLTGKPLPAWQVTRAGQASAMTADAAVEGESVDVGNGANAFSDSGWSALLDNALDNVAGTSRPEQTFTVSRARPDALLSVNPMAAQPTAAAGEAVSAGKALENVPGISLRSPHFATLLGNQVLWQARVGNQQAEIRLDPPELGPIEVRISQKDSETHLHFVVGHQATREQLEQALPRLRELFGQGGLQLGQVAVEQGHRETASGHDQKASSSANGGQSNSERDESAPVVTRQLSTSLIDAYA